MSNAEETERYTSTFLANVGGFMLPGASQKLVEDPSSDNYQYYLDDAIKSEPSILQRYKNYINHEANSPVQSGNSQLTNSGSSIPDVEDLNRDNTLNETCLLYTSRCV